MSRCIAYAIKGTTRRRRQLKRNCRGVSTGRFTYRTITAVNVNDCEPRIVTTSLKVRRRTVPCVFYLFLLTIVWPRDFNFWPSDNDKSPLKSGEWTFSSTSSLCCLRRRPRKLKLFRCGTAWTTCFDTPRVCVCVCVCRPASLKHCRSIIYSHIFKHHSIIERLCLNFNSVHSIYLSFKNRWSTYAYGTEWGKQ